MRREIDAAGKVSMITGDFAVPSNNEQGPALLRNIAPHPDLAATFGADLIRVCMKREEDVAAARRAADEARERGIRLAHQSHAASLFERVEGSLRVLQGRRPAELRDHLRTRELVHRGRGLWTQDYRQTSTVSLQRVCAKSSS